MAMVGARRRNTISGLEGKVIFLSRSYADEELWEQRQVFHGLMLQLILLPAALRFPMAASTAMHRDTQSEDWVTSQTNRMHLIPTGVNVLSQKSALIQAV